MGEKRKSKKNECSTQSFCCRSYYREPGKVDFPLSQYADSKYPLLYAATREVFPATDTKIKWIVPGDPVIWENDTQIVRTPFSGNDREQWRAFEKHLQTIEDILWDGVPTSAFSYSVPAFSMTCSYSIAKTCGGAKHFLGRDPVVTDQLYLHVYQDCVLRTHENLAGTSTSEFLTEFSLRVIPTQPIRRR